MAKKLDKWPPVYSATKCFDVLDKIYKAYGKQVNTSLLTNILETTSKSSNFSKRLIALQAFGLCTVSKEILTISALGMKIVSNITTEERHGAMVESFNLLPVLKEISNRFPGGKLPEKQNLANLLTREYDVSSESIEKWTDFVVESFDFFVTNDIHEMLNSNLSAQRIVKNLVTPIEQNAYENTREKSSNLEQDNMMKIPLNKDGRYILIPKDLEKKELDYLVGWFDMWSSLHE